MLISVNAVLHLHTGQGAKVTANAREGLYPSSRIYVNSEYYWHFSIREERSGLARAAIGRSKRRWFDTQSIFPFIRLNSNGQTRNQHPRSHRPKVYGPTHYGTDRCRTGLSGDCRDIRVRYFHCLHVLAGDLVIVFLEAPIREGRRCRESMPSLRRQIRSRALSLSTSSILQSPVLAML